MKPVSNNYKQNINKHGKEIKAQIIYNDGEEHLLDSNVLFSVTPIVNGNILKSVMKQLDFESSVKVPKNTVITAQFGIKVGTSYEYITFGNYIVSEEPEYNAETYSYHHTCYDKMLYSMKTYEPLDITYPTTIRNYINAICERLGLTFKNINDTFANYNKYINLDLYDGYDYTYRDILDELAQATASTICINENTDELEIRYINDTQDSINEDYLKDVNVEFGEKYGPINSIVLSRSAESDNVYIQDEDSIEANGLCELKIIDNQIMNDNDRSTYLQDIFSKLSGLTYYINDFTSPGLTWYELCDMYTVQIGENQYPCVLLNDEIKITQGLEETIYTEMPEVSKTDYTKADKTDRRINQTYLIVDKQNQIIQGVVSTVTKQNQKISEVTQTVDSLRSQISEVADVTISADGTGSISLSNINESEPIRIELQPRGEDIAYLYPRNNLYPNDDLYPKGRTIRFESADYTIDYELPENLLYYDEENYDEFILDYEGQSCVINKKVAYNADGTKYLLPSMETISYAFPKIPLKEGDYTVTVLGYPSAYLFVRLMVQNIYTTQFATKAEVSSEINQTAQEINLEVSKKVGDNEIISKINQSAEQITIEADKININGTVSANGNFKVDTAGNLECKNAKFAGGEILLVSERNDIFKILRNDGSAFSYLSSKFLGINTASGFSGVDAGIMDTDEAYGGEAGFLDVMFPISENKTSMSSITGTGIKTPQLTQTSLESEKKNFEKVEDSVLDIIKNAEIYKWNLQFEKDTDKKHFGFVIPDLGGNYKTPDEVINKNNKGIDQYTMCSILWKAVQELTQEIEKLKEEKNGQD